MLCRYTRADGIAILILRRSGLASPRWSVREPYAQVVNIGTNNDGHTKEGITFPSAEAQGQLARQVILTVSHASSKSTLNFGGGQRQICSAIKAWSQNLTPTMVQADKVEDTPPLPVSFSAKRLESPALITEEKTTSSFTL